MGQHWESATPKDLTGSGIVSKTAGTLLGFYVNNTSAGTIVLYDGTDATGTQISGTITPAIGWHRFPAACVTGCYATIGGVSLDVTFHFAAG